MREVSSKIFLEKKKTGGFCLFLRTDYSENAEFRRARFLFTRSPVECSMAPWLHGSLAAWRLAAWLLGCLAAWLLGSLAPWLLGSLLWKSYPME
jgi:hypothetical protein